MSQRSQRRTGTALAITLTCLLCRSLAAQDVGLVRQSVVYGKDDRRDVRDVLDERLRQLALFSTVALVDATSLQRTSEGRLQLIAPTLSESLNVCPFERFALQPTAAECSGVLVAEQVVLTAGHCGDGCSRQRWVFQYALPRASDAAPADLEDADVYLCREVLTRMTRSDAAGSVWDYALIQLDRPVAKPRVPVEVAACAPAISDAISVIGYPNGLPVKVAFANVLSSDAQRGYFTMDSDTFDGSSGSGVFDLEGRLVGLFVRGKPDFVYRRDAACLVARVESEPDRAQEQAIYASWVREALTQNDSSAPQCADQAAPSFAGTDVVRCSTLVGPKSGSPWLWWPTWLYWLRRRWAAARSGERAHARGARAHFRRW